MANGIKRRSKLTYLGTMLSMALLLTLLFLGGAFNIFIKGVSEKVKEEVNLDVYFYNSVSESEATQIQKELLAEPYVSKAEYVSKDSAFSFISEGLGEVDESMLPEDNPMPSSVNVHLTASYFQLDSVQKFENWLMDNHAEQIEEVYYNKSQFNSINSNFNSVSRYIWILSLFLLVVTVVLIFVTIRLAIYSERFTLNTMQMVGAKSGFIKRPFMMNSIWLGLGAGLMAIPIVIGVFYLMAELDLNVDSLFAKKNELSLVSDSNSNDFLIFVYYFALLILGGVLISIASTWLALRKYIRLKTDNLY